jgi:hypothetical protein
VFRHGEKRVFRTLFDLNQKPVGGASGKNILLRATPLRA